MYVFQELCPTAGCQTYIHFCLVSEAISSPYVAVNAYRDTNPDMCCTGGRSYLPSGDVLRTGIFTPAGIYSHFPPSGHLLGFCIKMHFWHSAVTVYCFLIEIYIYCFLISPAFKRMTHHVSLPSKVSGGGKKAVFGI